MPHIEIKCFPGRTEEQKIECANRITDIITETLGCEAKSVSISIKDVDKSEWKSEVWDKCIINDTDHLYKKPGYSYDE